MSLECSICNCCCVLKRRVKDETFGFQCDLCRKAFCKDCTNLSTTESDCLVLGQRKLDYYCPECKKNCIAYMSDAESLERSYKRLQLELSSKDNEIEELQLRSDSLQIEADKSNAKVSELERYILRLKRNSECFEDLAADAESRLEERMDIQVKIIESLNIEIQQLKNQTQHKDNDIVNITSELHRIKEELLATEKLNTRTNLWLQTIEQESELLAKELKASQIRNVDLEEDLEGKREHISEYKREIENLRGQLDKWGKKQFSSVFEEMDGNQDGKTEADRKKRQAPDTVLVEPLTLSSATLKKPDIENGQLNKAEKADGTVEKSKILLLTDEYGKYLLPYLRRVFPGFTVQVICKPNANFKNVITGQNASLSEMTSKDYVLVLAGLNNSDIRMSDITLLTNMCFYTNLIVGTIPAKFEGTTPFKNIELVNRKITNCINNLRKFATNIQCIDIYNKFRFSDYNNNIFLNSKGLAKMASIFKHFIYNINSIPSSSCLKLVPLETSIYTPSLTCNQNGRFHSDSGHSLTGNSYMPSGRAFFNTDNTNSLTGTGLDGGDDGLVGGVQVVSSINIPPCPDLTYVQRTLSNGTTVNLLEPRECQSFLGTGEVVDRED